jgi:TupA-like ATPgrasp
MDKQVKPFIKRVRDRLVIAKNNNPWLLLLWHEMLRSRGKKELARYSDLDAVKRLYFSRAGRYPDLENPTLFSEKLQWIKLNYRDPMMTRCADKYEVRSFIEGKGYADILNGLIGVYDSVEEIDFNALPEKFVLKATHGSGWNIICHDKYGMNWTPLRLVMRSWLKNNIFWNGREWPYRDMMHRIVCEKYLEDASGQLTDYKFYCFNGEPRFVQANVGRGTDSHAQNFYDLKWALQPFGKDLIPRTDVSIPKPDNLEKMIAIARDLASPFPYVRADFYDVQGKVFFGELTFFPASGMPDFVPEKYDAIVGEMLALPTGNEHPKSV